MVGNILFFFLIHVDLTGLNAVAYRYLTKYVFFFMWYALLILCSISLYIFELLCSKGTLQNPVSLYPVPFKMIYFSFMMYMFVYVKNALHPSSHIFLMEIN